MVIAYVHDVKTPEHVLQKATLRVITGPVKNYVTIIRTHMKYLNNGHKINQILAVTKRVTAPDFILKEMTNS